MSRQSFRRWWAHRFRTRIRPGYYNAHGGKAGQPLGDLVHVRLGWTVERPDWWARGSRSGVTDATVEAARARLDEWQDEMAARDA